MSGPRMIAFIAPKLKVALLQSFYNKKLLVVPVVLVFFKKSCECSLVRPFDTDPL